MKGVRIYVNWSGLTDFFITMTGLGMIVGAIAAWLTHIVWMIQTLMSPAGVTFGQIILGLLGLSIPPIGALHGLILWLS